MRRDPTQRVERLDERRAAVVDVTRTPSTTVRLNARGSEQYQATNSRIAWS
jgi:hypothetical protein